MRRGAPGEPVFAHPQAGCLSAAAWGGFARTLGLELADLEADSLIEQVRSGIETRLSERLAEAARHDDLVVGKSPVRRSMASEDVELVLVGSSPVDELVERARQAGCPVFEPFEDDRLGNTVGADSLSIVGIRPGERAEAIGRDSEKLICLEFDET